MSLRFPLSSVIPAFAGMTKLKWYGGYSSAPSTRNDFPLAAFWRIGINF
jgi:hypothetical protein